jgi:tetratricopeptide (TPR) repeat protein
LAYRAIHAAAAPGSAPEGARGPGRRLPGIAPIAVAAVAFAAALLLALRGRPDAGFSVAGTSAWRYFLTALRAMVVYLRLLAWPAGQSADWDFRTSPGLADPATLGAALAVGTLAAAAILLLVRGRRDPSPRGATARLAGLGVAWYFVVLSVTSSFVPLSDNLVEHRAYLASWGVLLAAVVALDALAARLAAPTAATVAWVLVVAVLAAALHRRNAVWESREALWTDVVAKAPGSARARLGLAEALAAEGRTAAAIREYELALGLAGGNVAQRAKILLGLGAAQMAAGRAEDARRSLEAGLHFLPDDDELLATLALLAGATGDAAASESLARRALGRNPSHAVSWLVLGNLALERGDWPGALAAYDRAVATDPDRGEAHYGRALALGRLGRAGDACAALRTALVARLAPEYRASVESGMRELCR